ncbi:TonB family protein [Brevundimonas sp. NPDC092305]|uniref:TonB family protein n=1 Tax=Brevundimonas sp. NPDC092305 TaxID=3363957 RepID=UPI00381DACC3
MIALTIAAALLLDPSFAPDAVSKPVRNETLVRVQAAEPPALNLVAVTLECTARADGHVERCKVLEETHPGRGFGEAAIALMQGAEVEPGPRDMQFARTIQFTP